VVGRLVTYDNWKEIWIAEGLASYSEWLWLSTQDPTLVTAYALGQDPGYFTGALYGQRPGVRPTVYDKAAWVWSMLRFVVGDDAFFAGCDSSSPTSAAPTSPLGHSSSHGGVQRMELDWFFAEWVYARAAPCQQLVEESRRPAVRLRSSRCRPRPVSTGCRSRCG